VSVLEARLSLVGASRANAVPYHINGSRRVTVRSAEEAAVPPELIDTHAHLDDPQFAADLPAVIERAAAAGVRGVVCVATGAASSAASAALAARFDLACTVGIHPNHAAQESADAWDHVLQLIDAPRVVGVGETGLDRHWDFTPFAVQQDFFARHLELGKRRDLAVVIHCREADADMLPMLREHFDRHGPIRGVMHSFCGDADMAAACLAMGLHLSFAGMLTYKNAQALRAVAAGLPLDRLLVETDSPYLAPVPVRGKRNEPANVVHTAAVLAQALGVGPGTLAEQTTRNARALFGLSA
jgi:TatD DNase family protein